MKMPIPMVTSNSDTGIKAADSPTLRELSHDDYMDYIRTYLIQLNHREALLSGAAGYPLATTKAQAKALSRYIDEIAEQMSD